MAKSVNVHRSSLRHYLSAQKNRDSETSTNAGREQNIPISDNGIRHKIAPTSSSKIGHAHNTKSKVIQTPGNGCRPKQATTSMPRHKQHWKIQNIPDEILLKIFGNFNVGELIIASQVCHRWHVLANDESLWRPIFQKHIGKTESQKNGGVPSTQHLKAMYISSCVSQSNKKLLKFHKKKNPYTHVMPTADMKKAMLDCGVKWQLNLIDYNDMERNIECSDASWHLMSVSLHWNDLDNRQPSQIKQLKLYACIPLFYDSKAGTAIRNSPYKKSLILSVNRLHKELEHSRLLGGDKMVDVRVLSNGMLIGTWKNDGFLAFLSTGLHFNQLINRCIYGTASEPYNITALPAVHNDVKGIHGLYGFSLTVELRTLKNSIWDQQFRNIDMPRAQADLYAKGAHSSNSAQFSLVSPPDRHILQKKIVLPWRSIAFSGKVTNVCWMDVTVTDESSDVFWNVSYPVNAIEGSEMETLGTFDSMCYGTTYSLEFADSTGKFHLKISQSSEDECYYITEVTLGFTLKALNNRFGTNYKGV